MPNGFPVHALRPDSEPRASSLRGEFGLSADDFVLLFAGRYVHEKGHRFFLESLDLLRREGKRPKALIVGDGPLAVEVADEIARRGLEGQVMTRPSMPHAKLMDLLRESDLLVMASTHEGFPLSPAEAMALGKPVLATQVGGLPDLIEDGVSGVLVPPQDPRCAIFLNPLCLRPILSGVSSWQPADANGLCRGSVQNTSPAVSSRRIARHLVLSDGFVAVPSAEFFLTNIMHTLYLCYFGLREPLVQTQVLPYLRELTRDGIQVTLLTFEPNRRRAWTREAVADWTQRLAAEGIHWRSLPYHKTSLPAMTVVFDILVGGWGSRRGSLAASGSTSSTGVATLEPPSACSGEATLPRSIAVRHPGNPRRGVRRCRSLEERRTQIQAPQGGGEENRGGY